MNKVLLSLIALITLAISTTGCSTVLGPFNGLGSDEMSMLAITTYNGQAPTPEQYRAVAEVAKRQAQVIGWQLSSSGESAVVSALAGGAAGAAGGATQGIIYTGASGGSAAAYTAAVYGLGYMINGLITASYANVFAVAQATELAIRDHERYDPAYKELFKGVHVVAAFIRSGNTHEGPSSDMASRMNWHGPKVGR